MFDCGLHPGRTGTQALPDLHSKWFHPDIREVDIMLITHFHHDHCAGVPYVVGRTNFQGLILMTHATKAIYFHILKDYISITTKNNTNLLYGEKELYQSMRYIKTIDFHQKTVLKGIKIIPYVAGHVLGAAMFMIEIDGLRLLYTGDYSRQSDRHMPSAELPGITPHIIIVEGTYGVRNHLPMFAR
jgi:cleavage and polyadenylation specificity factor subunit 3